MGRLSESERRSGASGASLQFQPKSFRVSRVQGIQIGGHPMAAISLQNPLFATYAIAATLMILKVVAMSWLTVARMMRVNSGFRSVEDLRKTPLNPSPDPKQLEPNEYVDRIRRIQLNDLENIPFFLAAGFL
jgi:glutathione S-transferase